MNAFHQLLDSLPVSMLFVAMNVAIAASVVCALALIASWLREISLPVRHAICVCGVAGTIVTPLLVLSLERWTPGFAEITLSEQSSRKQSSSEFSAVRAHAAQHVTLPHASFFDQQKTESRAIDVTTRPGVLDDSVAAESEYSATAASLNNAYSAANFSNGPTFYRLILCRFIVLAWFFGSMTLLLRRVLAEIRLRKWLVTCNPIADVETVQAAQSAAIFVRLNEQSPLRRLAVQFRLRRWSARRSRIAEAETLEAVQSAATFVGLNDRPFLLRSKTLPAPVVCGWLQPKLILPEAMANGDDGLLHNQLVAVLTHEMAHLARRDLVTGLCLTIARIAYWWNPLVRMLCSRTEHFSEQICDDIATASLSQPREYASALLHFAERSTSFTPQAASLGLSVSTVSQLEIRVRRILHSTRSTSLRVSATASMIVVLLATVLTAAASMMQIREAADDKPSAENNAAQPPLTRPSLDDLFAKVEALENAYVPFQISVTETMRANEELTPEQLNGIRYAVDGDSEWGSVYGRIQVTNPQNIDLRPRQLIRGGANPNFPAIVFSDDLHVDQQTGGLTGAFVYLAKAPAAIHPEAARAPFTPLIFDQAGGRFVPHLMIVRVGQSVECVNTSTIATSMHNYPWKNQALNLMLRPLTNPGVGHLWTPKLGESLPMSVRSDHHPWMQAHWLVVDHPYAAITDKHGRFVIENLPPGNHVFKVWHERVGFIERKLEITVEPGKVTAQPTVSVDATAFSVR